MPHSAHTWNASSGSTRAQWWCGVERSKAPRGRVVSVSGSVSVRVCLFAGWCGGHGVRGGGGEEHGCVCVT